MGQRSKYELSRAERFKCSYEQLFSCLIVLVGQLVTACACSTTKDYIRAEYKLSPNYFAYTCHQTTTFFKIYNISQNTCTNIKHKIFEEFVSSILPLLKKHIRLKTRWNRRPFRLIYQSRLKKMKKNEMIYMHNSKYQCHGAHTANQLTNPSC